MYKYSEEQKRKIKEDREVLKRYDENCRAIRSAARGGDVTIAGEVLEKAKEEVRLCDEYIAGLEGLEKTIFYNHYVKSVSLQVIGDDQRKSRSCCDDRINRQLARRSLDGQSGEQSERRTYRPRPQRRRKGE